MILKQFTQADLGAGPVTLFDSHAEGGLYAVRFEWIRTALSGSGDAQITLAMTAHSGASDNLVNGFSVSSTTRWVEDRHMTLQHPSSVTASLVNQGFSGTFSADLRVYVARLKDEGSD